MIRSVLAALALFVFSASDVYAQGAQCRTVPAGTQTSNCASENTVAESRGTLTPGTFSTLASCSSANEGTTTDVTDSTTDTFGAVITGGGSFHVLGYCNGTNWTVAGGGASPLPPNPGTVTDVATAGLATGGPITGAGTVTVTAAVKTDQTTATSESVSVTPSVQQFHPSAVKTHGLVTGATGAILESYGVSRVTLGSTGMYTVVWLTPFTSANYACTATSESTAGSNGFMQVFLNSRTASQIVFEAVTTTPAAFNPTTFSFSCEGTQ
jgi:hypothetical protein